MVQHYGHDIRAAVSDVIGGLRLLDYARLDPDIQAQLDRVRVAGETLAELVEGALLAAAGDEVPPPKPEVFNLNRFLTALDMRWSGQALERGRRFRLVRHDDLPTQVALPRVALDRVLGNLIGNSLKHATAGEVWLRAYTSADGSLLFRVSDEGPGFPTALLKHGVSEAPRPSGHQRSGLGLQIAHDLARAMNGTLDLADGLGRGAVAILRLPRDVWLPRASKTDDLPDLSGLRVFVAEDNETNQILVRQMLEKLGATMALARDGAEALEMLSQGGYDIALIDIEMPRLSGIEVMRRLRATDLPEMPLVALTAYVLRDNREAIFDAGADGIIAKPIQSVADFGRAILRHVGRTVIATAPGPEATVPGEVMDRVRFDALMEAAGPDGRGELLAHLLEDLQSVAKAMAQGLAENRLQEVRAQTHILISLAGAVGADRLQHLAEAVNAAAQRQRMAQLPGLVAACQQDLGALIDKVAAYAAICGDGQTP